MAQIYFGKSPLFVVLMAFAGPAVLSGCTQLSAQSRANPRMAAVYGLQADKSGTHKSGNASRDTCPLTKARYDTRVGAINIDCFILPGETETAYHQAVSAPTDSDRQLARNRLASAIIGQADANCTLILGKLTSDEATVNTTFSTLTSGLTAAGTIVSGELAKSILSGVASVSSASQSHIGLYVYRNQIAPVIVHAINVEREKKLKEIRDNFEQPLSKWPVDLAVRDINAYYQDCSLSRGFEILLATTESAKNLTEYKKSIETKNAIAEYDALIAKLNATNTTTFTTAQANDFSQLVLDTEKKRAALVAGAN